MSEQEWPKCTACGEWMRECMCPTLPVDNWLTREFMRANARAESLPPHARPVQVHPDCGHPNHGGWDHACAPFRGDVSP